MGITFTYKSAEEDVWSNSASQASIKSDGKQLVPAEPKTLHNDLLPEFTVETRKLGTLVTAKKSVRKTSKRQVARVARAIRALGFRNPPLVGEDGEIIDGHTRVEAARAVGLKEIPCIVVGDLSEQEIQLLRIALNRIQERGEWDEPALKMEMVYLLEFEPDLTVTGFEAPEIDRLVILDDVETGEPDPLDKLGALPKPDAQAVTRPGDVYHLGEHRVGYVLGQATHRSRLRMLPGGIEALRRITQPRVAVRNWSWLCSTQHLSRGFGGRRNHWPGLFRCDPWFDGETGMEALARRRPPTDRRIRYPRVSL